ncbi:aspartate/glutamate racemase family protein [Ornithinimicrobium cerasi]|uniref:aspartate/glutamate racemase family protein n=1 Tax=Ornithinimicrobium cerasi TaxID=2248773 RepID=UPI000F0005FF|nr:amino acid racemase [Ornithinimicrobium cerasi]
MSAGRLLPDTWRRPVLGVLGGMGPAATVSFLDALTRATPAGRDQEHIDAVVLNHVSTPDRTARLRDPAQPDPTPYLTGDLELLARLGVDLAVIVCNTSHAFLDLDAVPVRLLSIVEVGAEAAVARARQVGEEAGGGCVVTLLATDGTLGSGLYQDALARRGATVRVPAPHDQRRVMGVIYEGVKAGVPVPTADFAALVEELRGGAGTVLLGCTELSVLFDHAATEGTALPGYVVDAQDELVGRVVAELAPRG